MKMTSPWKGFFRCGLIAAAVAMLVATACDPDIPERDATPERVEAVFDPGTGVIPLPNDAAMSDGFLPGLPGAEEGTAAGELSEYLSGLTGWPRTTDLEIPFSGALDEESIDDDSVRLYHVDGDEELQRMEIAELVYEEAADGTSLVRIIPEQSLAPGEQYAMVATNEITDPQGLGVSVSLPVFYAASRAPLVDADGQPALEVMADDPATAQALEGLRQLYAPVFEGIEEGVGADDAIDRDDVVSLSRWTLMPETAAAFFPDAAQVPLPNTAALDPDGTFPDAGTCYLGLDDVDPEDRNNVVFDRYLAGLSGWPDSSPITVPLTGPVDAATIGADDVQLWKRENGDWQRVESIQVIYRDSQIDNCTGEEVPGHSIDVVLLEEDPDGEPGDMRPAAMDVRSDYFAFATRNIEAADGSSIVPEAPLLLMMQPYPLVDDDGASTVSSLDDEDAQALEALRQLLAPLMDVIEAEEGLDHRQLAAAWTWFTWNDTFAVFDPDAGRIPFPHLALMDDETGTVDIPIPSGISPAQQAMLEALNRRSGFSRSAPGWVPLDGEIDPATLDSSSFRLFSQGASLFVDADDIALSYEPGLSRIVYEPVEPFRADDTYLGVVTDQLIGANGRPVQASPIMVFLSMEDPLHVDGESRVWPLPDETAEDVATLEALEEARQAFALAFNVLELLLNQDGLSRDNFASVWAMGTEDPIHMLREYRALALDVFDARGDRDARRACEVDGTCNPPDDDPYLFEVGDELEDPNDPGVMVDMSNVALIQRGAEFDAISVDVGQQEVFDDDERVGFMVFVPEQDQDGDQCEAPYDVVIAHHGMNSDRWQSGLALANDLAAYPNCMATVSMDLPIHGGRAPGAASTHPESLPEFSGAGFLSDDFLDSKNNFVQAMIDLWVLTRIIEGEGGVSGLDPLFADILDQLPIDDGDPLFSQQIGFVGMSLGGIVGVPFVALDPAVNTVALNGVGGRLTWLLLGDEDGPSTIGEPLLDELADIGMAPGTPAFFEAMVFVQWLADAIDPFLFAEVAIGGDLPTLSYDEASQSFSPTRGDTCDQTSDCPEGWQCETISGVERCVEYVAPAEFLVQMSQGDRTIVNRSTEAMAAQLGVDLTPTTFEDVPHAFIGIVDESRPEYSDAQCGREQVTTWLRSGLDGAAELPAELHAQQCQ